MLRVVAYIGLRFLLTGLNVRLPHDWRLYSERIA